MHVCIYMQDTCFQKHNFKNLYDKHNYYAFLHLYPFLSTPEKTYMYLKKG